jgi:Salmonella virulence plasmid 65kDa B protein
MPYILSPSRGYAFSSKRILGVIAITALSSFSLAVYASINVSPNGAATYSFPIQVVPGINGLEPKISLRYNSHGGVNLLGQGWSVDGFSSITRCPRTTLDDGFNQPVIGVNGQQATTYRSHTIYSDGFCLDGKRLIKSDASGYISADGVYHFEREEFTQATFNSSTNQWIVQTKDGRKLIYNKSPELNTTFVWSLASITDLSGNTINYTYTSDSNNAAIRTTKISYGSSSTPSVINFMYEPRPDPQSAWFSFTPSSNSQRLRMIQVLAYSNQINSSNANNNQMEVRRYLLSYSTSNRQKSLLTQIQECVPAQGSEITAVSDTTTNSKTNQKCLPPVRMSYGTAPTGFSSTALTGPYLPDSNGFNSTSLFSPAYLFTDLDQDSIADACYYTASSTSVNCLFGRQTSNGITWNTSGWGSLSLTPLSGGIPFTSAKIVDGNGDSKPDFCARFYDSGVKCYLNSGSGFNGGTISGPTFSNANGWAPAPYANSIAYLELNNDGYTDVCGHDANGLHCFLFNPSTGSFSATEQQSPIGFLNNIGTVIGSGPNGPVFNAPAGTVGMIASGLSQFSGPITTYNSIRYGDIDGDGYIDACALVLGKSTYTNPSNNTVDTIFVACWVNDGSGNLNGTSHKASYRLVGSIPLDTKTIPFTNPRDSLGNFSIQMAPILVDLDGNGMADVCVRTMNGLKCFGNTYPKLSYTDPASGEYTYFNPIKVDGLTQNVPTIPGSSSTSPSLGLFPDSWMDKAGHPNDFSNIQFWDVDGDNRVDVCSRSYQGLFCMQSQPSASGASYPVKFVPNQFGLAPYGCTSNSSGACLSDSVYPSESTYPSWQFFSMPNKLTGLFVRASSGASPIYTFTGSGNWLSSSSSTPAGDLLTQVQAGAKPAININYQVGGLNTSVYSKGSSASSVTKSDKKAFDLMETIPIVSQISTTDPYDSHVTSSSYSYSGLVSQMGRGLLGFGSILTTLQPSNTWTYTVYHQDWPYIGLPSQVSTGNFNKSNSTANWLTKTSYSYRGSDLANGSNTAAQASPPASNCNVNDPNYTAPTYINAQLSNGIYLVYPYRTTKSVQSINGLHAISTETTDTMIETAQGNVTCVDVVTQDTSTGLHTGQQWEKRTINTYDQTSQWTSNGNWILGRLTKKVVMNAAPSGFFPSVSAGTNTASGIAYQPNTNDGSLGPVYPDIMPWFIPVMNLLMQ